MASERKTHPGFLAPYALLACACAAPAYAQSVEIDHEAIRRSRVATAMRIAEPIVFDGRLDEPMWQVAEPATDFLQKRPDNGAAATERTEGRFLYDDDNLYIGVRCFDSDPARMLIKDLREDFEFGQTDLVQVFLDSLHDERSGFTFSVNPGGARRDTQASNNSGTNQDWDGVWDAKVSRNEEGWETPSVGHLGFEYFQFEDCKYSDPRWTRTLCLSVSVFRGGETQREDSWSALARFCRF